MATQPRPACRPARRFRKAPRAGHGDSPGNPSILNVLFFRRNRKCPHCSACFTFGCLAAAAILVGGCGYQQSGSSANAPAGYHWSSLYRQDVKTVAVPIFANKNRLPRRRVRADRSDRERRLEAHTPYKIVPQGKADTILEGEITRVLVRTISDNQIANIPQEQLYMVRVNFTWKDLRTGRILVERKDYDQAAPYYPTLGEGQFTAEKNVERLWPRDRAGVAGGNGEGKSEVKSLKAEKRAKNQRPFRLQTFDSDFADGNPSEPPVSFPAFIPVVRAD